MKLIPYSTQNITRDDILSVVKVLKSKYLTKGSRTLNFEKKIKKIVGSKYAAGVINASSALILACKAIGLKKNDRVWTSSITYIASINAGIHCGAKIDLVDINLNDYNICVKSLEKKLEHSKKKNCLPKILVVVHLAGYPADLEYLKFLSKKYNFKIIEDASHAFGAKYKGSRIGDCKYSDITVFSFHPVKVITSAEGGAITTNNKIIYDKILQLRENGILRKKKQRDPNYYDIVDLGYNFRINEINSTLGISQIKKTKNFINKKKKIANFYYQNLDLRNIILPKYKRDRSSALHLFIIRLKKKKNIVIKMLKKKGIIVNTHYIPLQYFTFIKKFKKFSNLKNSEEYYKTSISIPIYPHLTFKERSYVVKIINETTL
jgi:dTDP-4-amino-4,6-dideoxygalactose transaminase